MEALDLLLADLDLAARIEMQARPAGKQKHPAVPTEQAAS
jgi:hypothetical protein